MLKKISGLITIVIFAVTTGHSYATEHSTAKGACYVSHITADTDGPIQKNINCTIERKMSPHGMQVLLKFSDPKKQFTHAKILEANRNCSVETSALDDSCSNMVLFNGKKIVTSVFSDMTVYANNDGVTENSETVFTKSTPNVSTCSRFISMEESISICYKANAKNSKDVAAGFQ